MSERNVTPIEFEMKSNLFLLRSLTRLIASQRLLTRREMEKKVVSSLLSRI